MQSGGIPIIAGFQGINLHNRITTLGRGGSDASAIMCAKFFKAQKCIIYTDVEGVYTTDPKALKKAKKIKVISYEEMLEMASLGAKVMQPASLQDARLNRIDIDVKSSFTNKEGTLITKRKNIFSNKTIAGLTSTKNDAKVTLVGVKDKPGVAASVFKPFSQNYINVDMVVQTSSGNKRETDITFTIKLRWLIGFNKNRPVGAHCEPGAKCFLTLGGPRCHGDDLFYRPGLFQPNRLFDSDLTERVHCHLDIIQFNTGVIRFHSDLYVCIDHPLDGNQYFHCVSASNNLNPGRGIEPT